MRLGFSRRGRVDASSHTVAVSSDIDHSAWIVFAQQSHHLALTLTKGHGDQLSWNRHVLCHINLR
jgi:hypothetical protein